MESRDFSVLNVPSDTIILAATKEELAQDVPEGCFLAATIMQREAEDDLSALDSSLGPRLLVPEVWRDILPRAGILIGSSISGGTLRERLEDAEKDAPGRCWLFLEHLRMRFPLPCPSGVGDTISEEELNALLSAGPSFYTPELCCRYCYDLPEAMVLYDTGETWQEKINTARSAGFIGAVIPSEQKTFDNGLCPP